MNYFLDLILLITLAAGVIAAAILVFLLPRLLADLALRLATTFAAMRERRKRARELAELERQSLFLSAAARTALRNDQLKLYVAYRAAGHSCERRAAALGARS